MTEKFISACNIELLKNTASKGAWGDWKPDIKTLTQELSWHYAKLCQALLNNDVENIKEYSADVANICEKAYTLVVQAQEAECSFKVQCDSCTTCLVDCCAKSVIDLASIKIGDPTYYFLNDPGSCYHNKHIDGVYREASIKKI